MRGVRSNQRFVRIIVYLRKMCRIIVFIINRFCQLIAVMLHPENRPQPLSRFYFGVVGISVSGFIIVLSNFFR
ncbi:unnamed protein product [Tenebrio molitor]|jgi:hypothetical protein|nr:unnamed protein product [Tenebrio molitor]